MVFNAISDTIIKKKGSIVHFLFFINAEAICYFRLRKEMFKGCQTKRLSYSSPADSRYACITDSLGFIINHAFSLSCASVKKQEEKQPAYYKLECYMKNSIYKKENPQNSILINCLIQIFSFLYSMLNQYHRPFSNTYYKYSFSTMVISDLRFANIANVPVVVKKVF